MSPPAGPGRSGPLAVLVLGLAVAAAACTAESGESGRSGDTDAGTGASAPAAGSTASEEAPAVPAVTPAPEPPRPAEGACYVLRFDDAVAATSGVDASSCRREHTSRTFHVGTLDAVVDGHLLAVDSRYAQDQVAAECPRRLAGFLGGSPEDLRLTMLRAVWFTPTIAQSDAGADWYRCDVIALEGEERLTELGRGLEGILGRPADAERYALCGSTDPEDPDFERVLCSAEHEWRAIGTVAAGGLSDDGDFPGVRRLLEAGEGRCEEQARGVATDPLTVTWSYQPPTREQWRAGQRWGICWAPAQ